MLAGLNLPPSTVVKAVPRKCQANFSFFAPQIIKLSFCRAIQLSEDEREGASSASWAEMPLKFQSHWRLINTWLKARLGLRVGTSSLFLKVFPLWAMAHAIGLHGTLILLMTVNWHAVDQKDLKLFLNVCVGLPDKHCLCYVGKCFHM